MDQQFIAWRDRYRRSTTSAGFVRRAGTGFVGFCLNCHSRLTYCGIPFSGEFRCARCHVINVYAESQQPYGVRINGVIVAAEGKAR